MIFIRKSLWAINYKNNLLIRTFLGYICKSFSKTYCMKKIIFSFSLIFYTFLVVAQPKKTFVDNWYLNINTGPTFILGDVTQHYEWYKLDLSTPKMALGMYLTKEFNCVFAVRGQLGYGWLEGKKDYNRYDSAVNLSFDAHFYHFNAQVKINLIDLFAGGKCDRKFNLYCFAGLGFVNFQNRLYKDGIEWSSWGYGRSGKHKWVTEITIPFGLGIDARISQKWKVNLDIETMWVDNDKLDRVEEMSGHDFIIYPNIGISYNLSKHNRVCCKKTEVTPNYVSESIPANTVVPNVAKADSLNDLLDESFEKLNALNIGIANAQAAIAAMNAIIVKKATQYPDSINTAMKEAGYIWYNVYFDFDKFDIKPEYDSVIAKVAEIMKKEPELEVIVSGNADQRGTLPYNDDLSKKRAQEVINVMVSKNGINRHRLELEYKGEREPVSNIHFEENRRVDFIKINK